MEMMDNEQEDAFVAKKRAENVEHNTICRQRNQIDLTRKQLREANDRFRTARRLIRGACILQNAVLSEAATSPSAAGAAPPILFRKRPAQTDNTESRRCPSWT